MFEKKEVILTITEEEFEAFGTAIATEVGLFGNKFEFKVRRGDGYVVTVVGITDEVDRFIRKFEMSKKGYTIAL